MFEQLETEKHRTAVKKKIGSDKIIGTVKYHAGFTSKFQIKPRTIIVWLPPSYEKSSKNYPVLYMHDGQNILDPKTSFAGFDWRIDETLTKLIKRNIVEEIIVVGIYNTSDRLEEYSDTLKGHNYRRFISEELKPFIDDTYRTLPDRENTAVMGSSMGGLCSLLTILNHSSVFSKAACISSSFYYNGDSAFRAIQNIITVKRSVKIYLDSGDDGRMDAQRMFAVLTSKGFKIGEDLDYFYDKGAVHSEIAWANRLERPLKFFFEKKKE